MVPFTLMALATAPYALPGLDTWKASFDDSMCVAQRQFGTADAPITLAIRRTPLSEYISFYLITPSKDIEYRTGTAELSAAPTGLTTKGYFTSASYLANPKLRLTRFVLETADILAPLPSTRILTLNAKSFLKISVVTDAMGPALLALHDCSRTAALRWGATAAAMDAVARPVVRIKQDRWFRPSDYPADAIRAGVSGATTMLWTVDLSGRVAACKVVGPSGNLALDRAGCRMGIERARFRPAIDQAGRPISSYTSQRVTWITPPNSSRIVTAPALSLPTAPPP